MATQVHLSINNIKRKTIFDWVKEGFVEGDYVLLQTSKGLIEEIITELKECNKILKKGIESEEIIPLEALEKTGLILQRVEKNIKEIVEKIKETC